MRLLYVLLFSLICSPVVFAEVTSVDETLIKIQGPVPEIKPIDGYVPNEIVASEVAQAILKPILKDKLKDELPFRISKKDKVWFVNGKERRKCEPSDKNCYQLDGSSVHMEIDSRDGRVLKLYKFK